MPSSSEAVPQETIERIQALASQGFTGSEIRKKLGVSEYAAYRYGNPVRVKKPPLTDEQKAEFQRLRNSGVPCTEIARRYGVAHKTVYDYTTSSKALKQKQEDARAEERYRINTLYRSGLSMTKIAEDLGCSIGHVSTVLRTQKGGSAVCRYKPDGGTHRGTIRALTRAGWSSATIASELSATPEWVDGVISDIERKEGLMYQDDSAYWKRYERQCERQCERRYERRYERKTKGDRACK